MRLLLMRHGIAAPLDDKITQDAVRPLTPEGRDKTREVAVGLRACDERPDLIATSPLQRARETAQIVREVYGHKSKAPRLETWAELEHAAPQELLARLFKIAQEDTILMVGHEPGLSRFVADVLTGSPNGFALDFKKAAVCTIEITFTDGANAAPQSTLLWYATPRQLRLMAEGE